MRDMETTLSFYQYVTRFGISTCLKKLCHEQLRELDVTINVYGIETIMQLILVQKD